MRRWLLLGGVAVVVLTALVGRFSPGASRQQSTTAPSYETYTKIGEKVPAFEVTMLDGKQFSPAAYTGKVVVINLWATWCGPCKQEMPRLERDLWKNANADDFMMVAIAREETDKQIGDFAKSNGYTFPIAADPDRRVFKLFASAGIPRTYVIGRDGTILYQSLGYSPEEFDELIAAVKSAVH